MSIISDSDYLKTREIVQEYEKHYYNEILKGNHKQFILHSELGVVCRCGQKAVKIRTNDLFVCPTFTAYTCKYSKK